MRWNCPHCGTPLAVQDDKLSSGWSFSKCYKCNQFTLVRRSDSALIKVSQSPPATNKAAIPTRPTQLMLSSIATQRLAEINSRNIKSNVIPPPPPYGPVIIVSATSPAIGC